MHNLNMGQLANIKTELLENCKNIKPDADNSYLFDIFSSIGDSLYHVVIDLYDETAKVYIECDECEDIRLFEVSNLTVEGIASLLCQYDMFKDEEDEIKCDFRYRGDDHEYHCAKREHCSNEYCEPSPNCGRSA